MTKKHLRQFSETARKQRINELPDWEAALFIASAMGFRKKYEVSRVFRELVEEKSRFIPKIFGDIE
jgi:hypothetical protein